MTSTTVLARQLAAGRPSRATPLDAFKLARRQFIAGQRVEMQRLAEELGVSRVTLHRWVGSRDQLLGEVLWSLGKPTFDHARARVSSNGGQAVADAMEAFLEDVLAAPFMRAFLQREGEIALRIMTTARSRFQANIVSYIRELITSEMSDQQLPLELDDLAYLVTRIGESFFYIDIIAGGQPDPHKASQAIAALLA
jgi:AcrR family transcriptional regulator